MKSQTPDKIGGMITWVRGELQDEDFPTKEYDCSGESEDGRKWIGRWQEWDGEDVEITLIEEA